MLLQNEWSMAPRQYLHVASPLTLFSNEICVEVALNSLCFLTSLVLMVLGEVINKCRLLLVLSQSGYFMHWNKMHVIFSIVWLSSFGRQSLNQFLRKQLFLFKYKFIFLQRIYFDISVTNITNTVVSKSITFSPLEAGILLC